MMFDFYSRLPNHPNRGREYEVLSEKEILAYKTTW